MTKSGNLYIADPGHWFVLTKYGYMKTPEKLKAKRKIGYPIEGFERQIPAFAVESEAVVECLDFHCEYEELGACGNVAECMWCPVMTSGGKAV